MTNLQDVIVTRIIPGTNIRTELDGLGELVASVKKHGILQPITVEPMPQGQKLQIVTGGRRFAAALKAGLERIPCIILEAPLSTEERVLAQITENVQRASLQPLDEAAALERYLQLTGATQLQLANALGKSEAWVARTLTLSRNLTQEEKLELRTAPVMPAKETLIQAAKLKTPSLRAAALRGEYSSNEAKTLVQRDHRSHNAKEQKPFRFHVDLGYADVAVKFKRPHVTKAECVKALKAALQAVMESKKITQISEVTR